MALLCPSNTGEPYGAIQSIEGGGGDYLIVPLSHPTFKGEKFEDLPKGYKDISYPQIERIRTDPDPLPHWEAITGAFSVMDGEIIRFIIAHNPNLKKFIRYELACCGFDKDHQWVGFDKAKTIWLK